MAGEILHSFSSPGTSPHGIMFDGKFLWHSDVGSDLISEIDPFNGVVENSFSAPGNAVRALGFDKKNMYAFHTGFNVPVFFIDRNGKTLRFFSIMPIQANAGGFDGRYIITMLGAPPGESRFYNRDGVLVKTISTSGLFLGITFDGKYYWTVTSTTVACFDRDFNQINSFAGPANTLKDITFDGVSLWVTDDTAAAERIYKIRRG